MRIYWTWNSPRLFGPWAFIGTKGERTYGFGFKTMVVPGPGGTEVGATVLLGRWCFSAGYSFRFVVTKRLRRPTHG